MSDFKLDKDPLAAAKKLGEVIPEYAALIDDREPSPKFIALAIKLAIEDERISYPGPNS